MSRAKRPGETREDWAKRSFFVAGEIVGVDPLLAPEEAAERAQTLRNEVGRRLAIWDRLVLVWPDNKPIEGLYDEVIATARRHLPAKDRLGPLPVIDDATHAPGPGGVLCGTHRYQPVGDPPLRLAPDGEAPTCPDCARGPCAGSGEPATPCPTDGVLGRCSTCLRYLTIEDGKLDAHA